MLTGGSVVLALFIGMHIFQHKKNKFTYDSEVPKVGKQVCC